MKIHIIYPAAGYGSRFTGNPPCLTLPEKTIQSQGFPDPAAGLPANKRLYPSRRYSGGLHQAIGLPVNKLLYPLDGKPLYRHGLDTLLGFMEECRETCTLTIVTQYREIMEFASELTAEKAYDRIHCLYNENSKEGISASLRLGVLADREKEADYYLFMVADQPWLRQDTLHRLLAGGPASGKGIACVCTTAHRGNPVLFAAGYREQLLALQGDRGGQQILNRYPEDICDIYVTEERELTDIDEYPFP